ncbi:MAG: 2OG-Fe(II) oxygenase [Bdellovibrionales bacterium]
MDSAFRIIDFKEKLPLYEKLGHAENFGDGSQTQFCHPLFEIIYQDLKPHLDFELEISSARIIYNLYDLPAMDWHLDAENPDDTNTAYTLLIYFDSMSPENGGHLEFKNQVVVPQRGMGVLINNLNQNSTHRATPMKEPRPRKLIKITFKKIF